MDHLKFFLNATLKQRIRFHSYIIHFHSSATRSFPFAFIIKHQTTIVNIMLVIIILVWVNFELQKYQNFIADGTRFEISILEIY